jgi:dienelactone hydrolase
MIARALIALFLLATSAFAQADRSLFDYDREAPLDVQTVSVEKRGHAEVRDISYASAVVGRVPAYLVVPTTAGPHAAIVYAHWMMEGAPNANRTEFLDEALEMAKHGVVSLLIESPMNRKDRREFPPEQRGAASLFYSRQMVVDIRRGLDLLVHMSDVDTGRIAVVGHSFGATAAAITAGVDARPSAYVIMAVALDQEHFLRHSTAPAISGLRASVPKADFEEYMRMAAPQNAAHYIAHAAPAAVLLQYAEADEYATVEDAQRSLAVASEPKELKMYPGGHELTPEARKDRVAWLLKQFREAE